MNLHQLIALMTGIVIEGDQIQVTFLGPAPLPPNHVFHVMVCESQHEVGPLTLVSASTICHFRSPSGELVEQFGHN